MENYAAYNYPDSGNSSPRSREIDFDNSWEEPSLSTSSTGSINNLKAKFMVSYGGKIQPRQHDNQLSYVGGETKILAVDRSIRFSSLIGKLSSLFPEAGACGDVSFKYQLPGEDLDALISVTNDDDLDHLIHEYDRLNRSSSKPARLRLFLFSASQPHAPPPSLHHSRDHAAHHHHTTAGQFGSGDSVKSDRERMFVDALNSAAQPPPPTAVPVPPPVAAAAVTNNVDYLFGLEKGIGVGVPAQMHAVSPPPPPSHHLPKLHDPIPDPDYGMPDPQIEARIQELNRLQLSANQQQQLQQQLQQQFHQQQQVQHQQQQVHHHQQLQQQQQMLYQAAAKNEENLVNAAVDPGYGQRYPDKFHQQQPQQTFPAGYWPPDQKNMVTSGGFQSTIGVEQQPVYMIPAATGAVYHTPVMRPVPQGMSAPPPPQQHQQQQQAAGYYPVQRVQAGGEVYRDMPVYGVVSTAPTVPSTVSPQVQRMATGGGYGGEGVGMQQMRQVPGGEMGGYAQVAYDGATGRQVYYATPPTGVGSGGGSTGGGGSVPVATPYQVAAAGGPAPAAAVVSNSTVVNGGGEGRSGGGGGESVGGGGKAVPKVSPNSGTV